MAENPYNPTKAPEARAASGGYTKRKYRAIVPGDLKQGAGDVAVTLVSVLVPIYNVEKYLRQCADSVLAQTHANIEVILVDDGSTDSSGSIADEHARADGRVQVIHKPNSGYGDSLNRALAESHGEWIAIVEPDDWVEPTMIETLLATAREFETTERRIDLVKADYVRVVNEREGASHEEPSAYAGVMAPTHQPFSIDEFPVPLRLHPSIWTALYRKPFLDELGIRFKPIPGAGWADNPFFLETMVAARAIAWSPEPVYHYREFEDGTLSHLRDWHIIADRWREMNDVLDKYDVRVPSILEAHACRGCAYLQMLQKDFEQTGELVLAAREMAETIEFDLVRRSSSIPMDYKLAYARCLPAGKGLELLSGWVSMQFRSRMGL